MCQKRNGRNTDKFDEQYSERIIVISIKRSVQVESLTLVWDSLQFTFYRDSSHGGVVSDKRFFLKSWILM